MLNAQSTLRKCNVIVRDNPCQGKAIAAHTLLRAALLLGNNRTCALRLSAVPATLAAI